MNEDLLRDVVAGGEQERRPEDTVEAEDVLADQVMCNGPELLAQVLARACVGERAQVVDQRVDPHVDHLLGVPRHRHAPRLAGAAEAEVPEPAFDEAARLVVTEVGNHELGLLVVEPEQLFLERG